MTEQEFERIQSELKASGLSTQRYLESVGVASTTYYYWRRKVEQESQLPAIAPIIIKPSEQREVATTPTINGVETQGVMVAFPNGVRAHFGAGSESVLMEVLNRSMNPDYVLS